MILQIEKAKKELMRNIEIYRLKLNTQINNKEEYKEILKTSEELDELINEYIRFTT